jgi:LysM repeat protein
LLQDALADFPANVQILDSGVLKIDSQDWSSIQISFTDPKLAGAGRATLAATQRNEVGYLIVAMAPAQRWSSLQPLFQGMINSFRFTEEIVVRPTDATPPPTPTPTPTPRIYIVQPGDTLSDIAVQFGVSMEALVNRNAIERPEYLRSGQKLIIPTQKR